MRNRIRLSSRGGNQKPLFAVLSVLIPAAIVGCADAGSEKKNSRSVPTDYVEGSFVVTAMSGTNADSLKSSSETVASELGCRVAAFDQINWGSSESTGVLSEEMINTFNVRFENCDFSKEGTASILSKFEAQTGISGAEAEAVAFAAPIRENDPNKASQDHLGFIRRDQACNASERNNKKPVVVAVVDSGIDVNHPDLKDMLYKDKNGRIIGANFVGAGAYMNPDDKLADGTGHGTHVAGLIGATANNTRGVVGVGSCANIKIMPVRVLNDRGTGSSIEIDRGVKWAADNGAHIINMSLGHTAVSYQSNPNFYRALYADLAKRDIIVFAAAGNDGYVNGGKTSDGGRQWSYPSSYDNVISVAATDSYGSLTSFSVRGDRVDIAAPGYRVLSTTVNGSYGRMSGTSMATPVAAGAYALALASAEQGFSENIDRIDVKEVESLLASSVLGNASISRGDVSAGGVIDVEKLVKATMAKYPKIEDEPVDTPANPGSGNITNPQPVSNPVVQPQPQPAAPKAFEFVGLKDGQKAGFPQKLEVNNLPEGTRYVYFLWGDSRYAFTKVYVKDGSTSAKDLDQWYLYGDRTLTAVAVSKYGRILKSTKVNLKGH